MKIDSVDIIAMVKLRVIFIAPNAFVFWFPGLQDGRFIDVVYQPHVDNNEQTALHHQQEITVTRQRYPGNRCLAFTMEIHIVVM